MGAALQKLGSAECERIARILLRETGKSVGSRMGVHCPWHEERTPGACWYDAEKDRATCYSCGNNGDIIDVFCAVEGISPEDTDSFRAFFAKFSPKAVLSRTGGGENTPKKERVRVWTPRSTTPEPDNALWVHEASQWVQKCAGRLTDEALVRLLQWGINPDTARDCSIGYQPEDRFVPFTRWGLPYAENDKGRERHIHLPQGFVFPVFDAAGTLLRVKVRQDTPRDENQKYKAIVGGANCYGIWGSHKSKVWFVTETERDAMLLWQELGPYGIGAMGTGSASLPPDAYSHSLLTKADCVINAMDNDHAGAKVSWGFDPTVPNFTWNTAYAHVLRWLVPSSIGKDPADLVGKIDITDWALAALPEHILQGCIATNKAMPDMDF